jgi:superfamily II DNA or RNA helicase
MYMTTLRPYQTAALNSIVKEYAGGCRQQLAALATGTGKTVIFAQLPTALEKELPGQTLVLAHRETLIDQAINQLRRYNPSLTVDKEMAEHHADPNADVIVGSVATLGRTGTKRAERFNWDNITKVVCDEAHHSTATTYQNVFQLAGVLQPDTKKLLLGVTATPARGDGKALAAVYKKIVYTYAIRQAIEDGWLVDVRGLRLNTRVSLDDVRTVAGDFAQDQLATVVNNPVRNQLIVKSWIDNAFGLQTVVFSVDIQHAKDLSAAFEVAGVKSAAIWGGDPAINNKLEMHKDGRLQVLVNCQVLTEGYDDWRIGCILLAKPTKSSTLFTQMVGRGTRLEEGTGNLVEALAAGRPVTKKDCLVIDVVDCAARHSLVTLPTLMGLNADMDLKGRSAVRSARAIEQAMEDNPHIDFSKLNDISTLKAYVESINLFDVKFPVEVTQHSSLSWYPTQSGGYSLMLPKHGRMQIQQNMLDKYDITALINGKKYAGVRDTLEQAFVAADDLVTNVTPETLKILSRSAHWHDDPATEPQKRTLRRLFKGRQTPYCICPVTSTEKLCPTCKARTDLTKGHACRLITAKIMEERAGKAAA